MTVSIEAMQASDWRQVRAIFADGLNTGLAAFLVDPPIWRDWSAGHLEIGRLVASSEGGENLGWSALAPVPAT